MASQMKLYVLSFCRHIEEMVVTSFSQPLKHLPMSQPSTGVIEVETKELTDDKDLLTGHAQKHQNLDLEQISSSSEASDDGMKHQDPLLRIRQCSGKQVCPKQRSGELCSLLQCSHLCTGSFCRRNQLPESTSVHHPHTHGRHHSGSSDNNSDSDDEQLSGWHNLDKNHRIPRNRLPHNGDDVEVDHGGSGRANTSNRLPTDRIAPFNQPLDDQMSDVLEEQDFQYSVQETSSHLSKEMVLGKVPLLLRREEKQKRLCYNNVKHVFSKPFVCNMPAFVGEQHT